MITCFDFLIKQNLNVCFLNHREVCIYMACPVVDQPLHRIKVYPLNIATYAVK